jgi:hypothetical protein
MTLKIGRDSASGEPFRAVHLNERASSASPRKCGNETTCRDRGVADLRPPATSSYLCTKPLGLALTTGRFTFSGPYSLRVDSCASWAKNSALLYSFLRVQNGTRTNLVHYSISGVDFAQYDKIALWPPLQRGMRLKLNELFAHDGTRDAQPTCCFRLIALSELDRLREQLALRLFNHSRMCIPNFPTTGSGDQLGNEAGKGRGILRRLARKIDRLTHFLRASRTGRQ